jgi:hypothetical protein
VSDLFSQDPFPRQEDVVGETQAALLGDGSPVRAEPEAPDDLAAAGVPVTAARYVPPDVCPSCGVPLPDPGHPVDASLRH